MDGKLVLPARPPLWKSVGSPAATVLPPGGSSVLLLLAPKLEFWFEIEFELELEMNLNLLVSELDDTESLLPALSSKSLPRLFCLSAGVCAVMGCT